jgi:transcriptional antiterminator RfaH
MRRFGVGEAAAAWIGALKNLAAAAPSRDPYGASKMAKETDELHWYCVRSQPKHEHIAAAHLRRTSGFEVFCPRLRMRKATTTGAKWFVEAMFPGYLFAKFPFATAHREVRYSPGVSGIVGFGSDCITVEESVIEALRAETGSQELIVVQPELAEGAEVRVISGALQGLEAVVTQVLPGKERVRILLEFLGRQIQADVDKPSVLPAQRHPLAQ